MDVCAVGVAQLVERSLLTPDVLRSIPVIGKFYITCLLLIALKDENKEIESSRTAHLKTLIGCWKSHD